MKLILVVDDERDFRAIVSHVLAIGGYAVVTAADGAEGLRLFDEREPDLVVLDGHLPDIDGFEVCRRLNSNPKTHFIPVVIVTALDSPSDRVRGLDAGADD